MSDPKRPHLACGKRPPTRPVLACGKRAPTRIVETQPKEQIQPIKLTLACGKRAPTRELIDKASLKPNLACGMRRPVFTDEQPQFVPIEAEEAQEEDQPMLACGKRPPTRELSPRLTCTPAMPLACFMPVAPISETISIEGTPIMAECWANPMKSEQPQLNFSTNLLNSAKYLWELTLYQSENFSTHEYCQYALNKYKQYFHALNEYFKEDREGILYPPDKDVHVVWVAHVLRTEKYENDCQAISSRRTVFRSELKHLTEREREDQSRFTKMFMGNFHVDKLPEVSITADDLMKDNNWYLHLLQENPNVTPGAPLSDAFLTEALKDYERYLWLIYKYRDQPNVELNASYKADIMWHSHILNTDDYVVDCTRFVGYIMNHEPWPARPIEEDNKIRNTNHELWKTEFGINDYLA